MKIFLPFKKDLNPYLDEIEKFSRFDFSYSHFTHFDESFDIVSIHWPEAIFDWLEPTDKQMKSLEEEIRKWQKAAKIVYTVHDERRHKGMTPRFTDLFALIERNADIFIHLGQYSKKDYENRYPNASHEIIYHPVYRNSYKLLEKSNARKKLGIGQESIVFAIPGQIRNKKEKDLVLNCYNKLSINKKVLVAPRMRNEMEFDFKGRIRLKKFFDLQSFIKNRFEKKYKPPHYIFNYHKLSENKISEIMSASDIIIIPRTNSLNSGILFLGLTYNKIVVGPAIGNIFEHLKQLGYLSYNPKSQRSLLTSLKKAVNLNKNDFKIDQALIKKYEPVNISAQWDKTLKKLL